MSKREKRNNPRRMLLEPLICEIGTPKSRGEAIDVQTLDVSKEGVCIMTEGVCIMTDRALESGRVVMLRCPNKILRLAEVRWVDLAGSRFKIGLQFRV
jgi:hypothetical protein